MFQTEDLLSLHHKVCPRSTPTDKTVQISLDGVSESKSTSISLDVYSSSFLHCKNIYPHKIVRPLNKFPVDNRKHFKSVLDDISSNLCIIEQFVGDNPKRAIVREARSHGGYYACEYCIGKATHNIHLTAAEEKEKNDRKKQHDLHCKDILKKIDYLKSMACSSSQAEINNSEIDILNQILSDIKKHYETENKVKKGHLVWPANTFTSPRRTLEGVNEIMENIDNEDISNLNVDDLQGFVGKSFLHNVPGFHFINSIPAEYMHSVCIGVIKRMLELTFNVGENRPRATKRKLSSPNSFNQYMSRIKVPREFSRRARNLDFAVLKAQEMRNILLFFFPIVLECIEVNAKERKLWQLLAFIIRACCLPNDEFQFVRKSLISQLSQQFYVLYEQLFSSKNCTYNTHVVASHLLQIRGDNPLTESSAFKFESFYAELRNSFTPGTVSPLKQMLQKIVLRRSLAHHCCQNSLFFSSNDTSLECNSLIYCFINNTHVIYSIQSIDGDIFSCFIHGRFPCHFNDTSCLPWSSIGVYKLGPLSNTIVLVKRSDVCGKVLKVMNYLVTCPQNVLREK